MHGNEIIIVMSNVQGLDNTPPLRNPMPETFKAFTLKLKLNIGVKSKII